MQLKEISIIEIIKSRIKKLLLDLTSIKAMTLLFFGIFVAHIAITENKIDPIGVGAMLALLGIREYFDTKQKNGGGK